MAVRRKKSRRNRHNTRRYAKHKARIKYSLLILVLILLCLLLFLLFAGDKTKVVNKVKKQSVTQEKPIISLEDTGRVVMKLGETYAETKYSAKDATGKDITDRVKVDLLSLNRSGEQDVKYSVIDDKGNVGEFTRKVYVEQNISYQTNGLAICMYHYVYNKANMPDKLTSNHIEEENLKQELLYLKEQNFYFPSWEEVRDYVDGKLLLPEKSIVLCFDDGPTFMENGIGILQEYEIPATSFVITSYFNDKQMLDGYKTPYLQFESHSDNMHRGGGQIGHGGIFTAMQKEDALIDLQRSIEICGSGKAFAYPFGDYSEECMATLETAGFLCAVTTENGKVYPGDNPFMLKRVRMQSEQSLSSFINSIE